jgi:multiple sugar transport system substrate-binding protein
MVQTTKKKWVVMVTLAALVLTSCAGKSPNHQATQESLTLRFGIPYNDLKPYYAPLIERFEEENPAITVQVSEFIPAGPINSTNAGTKVDAFLWLVWPDPMVTWQGEPTALNLQPFIVLENQGFRDTDFFPGMLDTFRRQGDLYGIPAAIDPSLLYYNRALFDAQGVPYPQAGWTWQDFLDTAKQLTTAAGEGEQQNSQWGFACSPEAGEAYLFVLQHGGVMFDDPLAPTVFVSGDPRVAEALQWYGDLAQVHHVCPTPRQLRGYPLDAVGLFASSKAAMLITSVSEGGGNGFSEAPWGFPWGAVSLPRDSAAGSWNLTSGYFISAQTTHPQEAWALVKSLSEQSQYSYRLGMPARRSIAGSEVYRQRVSAEIVAAALDTLDSAFRAPVPPAALFLSTTSHYDQLWTTFLSSSVSLLNGEITAEQMVKNLDYSPRGEYYANPP